MSKKKLESLLSYQERLAREKGLPPSRLMLQHAAVVPPLPASKEFQCDQCEFSSTSKRGLSKHKSCKHKKSEEPETLRESKQNQSLNLSQASEEREELFPVNADTAVVGGLSPPLCQSTNAPLTCAVSFDAQKKPKNRRGIGNKCRSSSKGKATSGPRTLDSVNKVQTCMTSYELF